MQELKINKAWKKNERAENKDTGAVYGPVYL